MPNFCDRSCFDSSRHSDRADIVSFSISIRNYGKRSNHIPRFIRNEIHASYKSLAFNRPFSSSVFSSLASLHARCTTLSQAPAVILQYQHALYGHFSISASPLDLYLHLLLFVAIILRIDFSSPHSGSTFPLPRDPTRSSLTQLPRSFPLPCLTWTMPLLVTKRPFSGLGTPKSPGQDHHKASERSFQHLKPYLLF